MAGTRVCRLITMQRFVAICYLAYKCTAATWTVGCWEKAVAGEGLLLHKARQVLGRC